MEVKEAEKIIKENLDDLTDMFGIGHWAVTVDFATTGSDSYQTGICDQDFKYETARITLYLNNIKSEEMLLRVLRHELFHILHHPFNEMIASIDAFILDQKPEFFSIVESLWVSAQEKMVKNLERMHRGHLEAKGK